MSSRWAQCLQGAHVLWLQNKHRSPSTPMLDTCYMVFVLMFCLLSCLYFGLFCLKNFVLSVSSDETFQTEALLTYNLTFSSQPFQNSVASSFFF